MIRFLFLSSIVFLFSCAEKAPSSPPLPVKNYGLHTYISDSLVRSDSLTLLYYFPVHARAAISDKRPLKSDSSVVMACSAAFTRLDDGGIDGLFIESGKIISRQINKRLGGACIIDSTGNIVITGSNMGEMFDSTWIEKARKEKLSVFQQIQLVRDSFPLVFRKDVSRFQRRAICLKSNVVIMVESKGPCTLQEFANSLQKEGFTQALYLDMGGWDEGWYRKENGAVHVIGEMRTATSQQSNWLLFEE